MKSRRVKVKEVVRLINGHPFSRKDWTADGAYKIIRIQNLNNNNSPFNRTNKKIAEKYFVRQGDILISWSASLGVYEWHDEVSILNQHIYKVEFITEEILKDYFRYIIDIALNELVFKMRGGGIKHLTKSMLDDYEFYLPSIEMQSKIISTLNLIQNLISKRQKTIELLDEYLRSVFLDMFGDPVTNPHKLPQEPLEFFGDWQSGGTPPTSEKKYYTDGNINWFTSGELNEVFIDNSAKKISKVAIEESKTKTVKANSLLIGMYDTAALKCSITTIVASCNQAIAFAEIDPQKANSIFVYFNIILSRNYLLNKRRGGRQKNLNLTIIKQILILNPSLEKQEKFVKKFCIVNSLKHNCLMNNELLSELFQSLQYSLFDFKNNLNEFEFFTKDQLKIEQLRDKLLEKNYEKTNIYDNDKNLLFEILEHTEKRNEEAKDNNEEYFDGLVLNFNDKKEIELKTNRDDKYETN